MSHDQTIADFFARCGLDIQVSIAGNAGPLVTRFGPAGLDVPAADLGHPLVKLGLAGVDGGGFGSMTGAYSLLAQQLELDSIKVQGEELRVAMRHPVHGISITVVFRSFGAVAAVRSWVIAKNDGPAPVILTDLSSAFLGGITSIPGHDVLLHHCRQTWEGEAQWQSMDARSAGLVRTSVHPDTGSFRIASTGSFTTSTHWPIVGVEDRTAGSCWFAVSEASSSWLLEIARASGWADEGGTHVLHATAANERHLGWWKELAPGEEFETEPATVGAVAGGIQEAAQALTLYRRASNPATSKKRPPCIFFNDYMNCLWGNPTVERLEPLIDAAADVGCEGFCIDAGWFGPRNEPFGAHFGTWQPSNDRFGDAGLEGIITRIRDRGMIPGLWLEIEVCDPKSNLAGRPDYWFIQRHGKRVLSNSRLFFNFAEPQVRTHFHAVIDRLVAMGVGFFKNDYNECIGVGHDAHGGAPAEGLQQHARGFLQFIDEVKTRHPELLLESCSSGAMRSDQGILSHFDIQSTSDQEIYWYYPSIVEGSLALMLPEGAGFWSYPCPHLFMDKGNDAVLDTPEFRAAMKDGEQTVFNMVTGLSGTLYLSGRIDKADDANQWLIAEGVSIAKELRDFYPNAIPIWPLGFHGIHDETCWNCVGHWCETGGILVLSLWRQKDAPETIHVPIEQMAGRGAKLEQLYPTASHRAEASWDDGAGNLTVKLEKPRSARMFRLRA